MLSDFDALIDLNVKIGRAEEEGDKKFLDGVLAPVLAFRRANGSFADRDSFLDGVKPSPRRPTEIESIRLLGEDRALVTCVVSMEIDAEKKRFHNVRLFARSEEGEWKLLGWANEPM